MGDYYNGNSYAYDDYPSVCRDSSEWTFRTPMSPTSRPMARQGSNESVISTYSYSNEGSHSESSDESHHLPNFPPTSFEGTYTSAAQEHDPNNGGTSSYGATGGEISHGTTRAGTSYGTTRAGTSYGTTGGATSYGSAGGECPYGSHPRAGSYGSSVGGTSYGSISGVTSYSSTGREGSYGTTGRESSYGISTTGGDTNYATTGREGSYGTTGDESSYNASTTRAGTSYGTSGGGASYGATRAETPPPTMGGEPEGWWQYYNFITNEDHPYWRLKDGIMPTEEYPETRNPDVLTPTIRSPNSQREELRFLCLNNQCDRSFKRKADLERHYSQRHTPTEHKHKYQCDWTRCSRSQKREGFGFGRSDHMRDHYRSFHHEDLPRRGHAGKENKSWWSSRQFVTEWWRCTKCLNRIYLENDGWACPKCKTTCEEERQMHRQEERSRRAEG